MHKKYRYKYIVSKKDKEGESESDDHECEERCDFDKRAKNFGIHDHVDAAYIETLHVE